MGGVFLPSDGERLKEIGFDVIFTPRATRARIVLTVKRPVDEKSGLLL